MLLKLLIILGIIVLFPLAFIIVGFAVYIALVPFLLLGEYIYMGIRELTLKHAKTKDSDNQCDKLKNNETRK